jgi:hypothetical protein
MTATAAPATATPELDALFAEVARRFDPGSAGALNAVFEWRVELPAAPPACYQLAVDAGSCGSQRDGCAEPSVVLTLSLSDLTDLITGRVTASRLLLAQRLRIEGNVLLAARLPGLFHRFGSAGSVPSVSRGREIRSGVPLRSSVGKLLPS